MCPQSLRKVFKDTFTIWPAAFCTRRVQCVCVCINCSLHTHCKHRHSTASGLARICDAKPHWPNPLTPPPRHGLHPIGALGRMSPRAHNWSLWSYFQVTHFLSWSSLGMDACEEGSGGMGSCWNWCVGLNNGPVLHAELNADVSNMFLWSGDPECGGFLGDTKVQSSKSLKLSAGVTPHPTGERADSVQNGR